jgi:hydrogenase maturation protein HypF
MTQTRNIRRLKATVRGAVQGVGFRPFVFRLADELRLNGWVSNSPQGVFLEVEGDEELLHRFLHRLVDEKPVRSFIQSLEHSILDPLGYAAFEIRESEQSGDKTTIVLADIATCPECLADIFDVNNRRYLYPFTNCTNCGPRFSIIEELPYDRPHTSMKSFPMCEECRKEYDDPRNRRFHAQPNACPVCGPRVESWGDDGSVLARDHAGIIVAAEAIRQGKIVAVKGIGGFQLMVDVRNDNAVRELRRRKQREEKPFALMYPSIEAVRNECEVASIEARLLTSAESPIVLLRKSNNTTGLAESVAPRNPYLGVMLPYSPLHHLLMRELNFPVVATSGNLSDEPMCTDEHEALVRLHGIADLFLVHNRPIVRHVDDSIVRVMAGREMVMRRARGYAPLPVHLREAVDQPVLAVGAHLKNSVALAVRDNVFVSQHIGDLETGEAYAAFQRVTSDLQKLYASQPGTIACDIHPEYLSTKYALGTGIPRASIQHHYAHVASCMAENELEGRVLGVSWDGTGYGPDGTIWGGEFLLTNEGGYERAASFRAFRLPGGARSIHEPRRTALGVLYEVFGDSLFDHTELYPLQSFTQSELRVFQQMLSHDVHSPWTTSVGRLFDAVASIAGLSQMLRFEGEAAMALEFSLAGNDSDACYRFDVAERQAFAGNGSSHQPRFVIEWKPMILGILDDLHANVPVSLIAQKFHNTLAEIVLHVAGLAGETRVVLSGGCFQNRYLTERTIARLRAEGFQPYWHQRVPPNDGGIALGQIFAVLRASTGQGGAQRASGQTIANVHQLKGEESI